MPRHDDSPPARIDTRRTPAFRCPSSFCEQAASRSDRLRLCPTENKTKRSSDRVGCARGKQLMSKRLLNFFRGAIMRKPWGRGSVGRAMRSQRIGQGFESPRLHHHKKTASRKRCRLLMVMTPSRSANLRATSHHARDVSLSPFSSAKASKPSVRAGSAAAQPTLSPFPDRP